MSKRKPKGKTPEERRANSLANLRPLEKGTERTKKIAQMGGKAVSITGQIRKIIESDKGAYTTEKLATAVLRAFKKGNSKVIQQVLDRLEGPVPQVMAGTITGDLNISIGAPPPPQEKNPLSTTAPDPSLDNANKEKSGASLKNKKPESASNENPSA